MVSVARTMQRVASCWPSWLALLAICLRLLIPALHDHGAHRHAGVVCCSAATAEPACACGKSHPEKGPAIGAAPAAPGPCLACELELAAPGAPVPVPLALPRLDVTRIHRPRRSGSARSRRKRHRHRARAPPAATVRRR